jgi:hypothetical protein
LNNEIYKLDSFDADKETASMEDDEHKYNKAGK